MVGSRRTWNTDEPGLGRPKALPSSAPCRASVIWMVLSGRRMPVNVHWLHRQRLEVLHAVTWPHATSTNPPLSHSAAHLHTSVRQAPPLPALHFQSLSLSPLLFPLHMTTCSYCDLITSHTALGQMYVLLDVLCVYRVSDVDVRVRLVTRRMGVNLLSELSLCASICVH